MGRLLPTLATAIVLFLTTAAHAEGWVVLGERPVVGDQIHVDIGCDAGAFTKVSFAVQNGTLEVSDFAVQFINGGPGPQNWHPPADPQWKAVQKSAEIDVPGNKRTLKWIEVKFKAPANSKAKIVVSGFRVGDASAADPQNIVKKAPDGTEKITTAPTADKAPEGWTPKGWTLVGERDIGSGDQVQLAYGKPGSFTKLAVTSDADVEIYGLSLRFVLNGPGLTSWRAQGNLAITGAERVRVVSFPGKGRALNVIDFRYRNVANGRAKIAVWVQ